MIRQGFEIPDSEFDEMSRVLTARVLEMDAGTARVLLLMLVGDVPDAVRRAIHLVDILPRPAAPALALVPGE